MITPLEVGFKSKRDQAESPCQFLAPMITRLEVEFNEVRSSLAPRETPPEEKEEAPTNQPPCQVFDSYRDLYYEGGTSSVYLWDLDGAARSFAGCFLYATDIRRKPLHNPRLDAHATAPTRLV